MKGGTSPQASGEFALLSWNGNSLELLAPGDLPAEARLVYDANMQSKPLVTKPSKGLVTANSCKHLTQSLAGQ